MQYNEARQLVVDLKSCSNSNEVQAVLNASQHWCLNGTREGVKDYLLEIAESPEFQGVVADVMRMVVGSGITLEGENITEELQEHFQRNAMQFVPDVITSIALLGMVPITWHIDPETHFPVFGVADLRMSTFHTFRNRLTGASVTMRMNELGIYDPMTEFYFVRRPNALGHLQSLVARLIPDWITLKKNRAEMIREMERPALFIVQRRAGFTEDEDDPLDEVLFSAQQREGLRKRNRDVMETEDVEVGGEKVNILKVAEGYEVVGAQFAEQTRQFARDTAIAKYNAARRDFRRQIYEGLGIPADSTEERRREYGSGRKESSVDINRAASNIAKLVGQALQQAIRMCYHIFALKDEETQRMLHRDMEQKKAERVIQYLEKPQRGEKFTETFDELMERFEAPEPNIEEYRELLKSRLPRVRMNPDTRLDAEGIRTIRESDAFDEEETRRLEAQALGVEVDTRERKRPKNLLQPEEPDEE